MKPIGAQVRAVLAAGLTACLLCGATALYGCKRRARVRFIKACPVHTAASHGSQTVGMTQPQHAYEIFDQKEGWYRIEVYDNKNWGWTACPTVE